MMGKERENPSDEIDLDEENSFLPSRKDEDFGKKKTGAVFGWRLLAMVITVVVLVSSLYKNSVFKQVSKKKEQPELSGETDFTPEEEITALGPNNETETDIYDVADNEESKLFDQEVSLEENKGGILAVNISHVQKISNDFANLVSNYTYPHPLKKRSLEYSFPFDPTLMKRIQDGNTSEEESRAISNKRIIFMGDSVDGYMLGTMATCKRRKDKTFQKAKSANVTCGYISKNTREHIVDMFFSSTLLRYNLDIVLHRVFYTVEPETPIKLVPVHKSYFKGSRLYKAQTQKERYKILLEDSLEKLPDKHKADFVLFNMNLWLMMRERIEGKIQSREYILESFANLLEVTKEFFSPKVIGFHTVSITTKYGDRAAKRVKEINEIIREFCAMYGYSLFDWEYMTKDLSATERLKDGMHPSHFLNGEFAKMQFHWMYHIGKYMEL